MKFSLTISELTAGDVDHIMNRVVGNGDTPNANVDVEVAPTAPVHPRVAEDTQHAAIIQAGKDVLQTAQPLPTPEVAGETVVDYIDPNAELDATGIPWDERIHTSTKKKTTKGFWKRKPRVDDAEFDRIVQELQDATPVEIEATAPVEQPVATPPAPTAPVAPVAPVAPATPPAAAANAPVARDFQGLMQQISKLFSSQQITPDYPPTIVQRINEGFGVTLATITDVANDERYVDYAWQCLDVDGKAA